jgi:hypothetical protein
MILILAGLFVSCRSHAPSGATDFFPASNAVPGWAKFGETRTFEASHLWEYIDGDADKYVQAGVVKTLTNDYRFNDKADATVDIYVMAKTEGAKQIYDSQASPETQPVAVGDAARYAKGSLTFRQGPYFVRLVTYADSPEMTPALIALATAVSDRLATAEKTRG